MREGRVWVINWGFVVARLPRLQHATTLREGNNPQRVEQSHRARCEHLKQERREYEGRRRAG